MGWIVVQKLAVSPSHAQGPEGIPGLRIFPASAEPPPEVFSEQDQLQEPAQERSTVQELEEKLFKLPGGREAIEKARSGRKLGLRKLPASAEPPPEEFSQQDEVPEPAQERSSVQELEQRLLSLPGWKKVIDKARRGERPIGMRWDGPGDLLSWLNLFRVEEAKAGETFTLTLSHSISPMRARIGNYEYNFRSEDPYAYLVFHGAWEAYSNPGSSYSRLYQTEKSWGDETSNAIEGYVGLLVDLPEDGWYIINLYGQTNGSVNLRHYESRDSIPIIQSLSSSGSDWDDYPFFGYFEAGRHYFYWTFSRYAVVSNVSVDSYP